MNKKMRTSVVVIGIGIFFSLFIFASFNTWSQAQKTELQGETPLVLSIANKFTKTEKPAVLFFHDLHAHSLKQEGCQACHPSDEKGITSYSFPKNKNDQNKMTLTNSYHTTCIGCHKKLTKGPVTCKTCHMSTTTTQTQTPRPEVPFNSYLHDLHSEPSQRECLICHHTGGNSSCRECHGETDNGIPSYKNAAHSSCLNCHLKSKAGPTSCRGCHSGTNESSEKMPETFSQNNGKQ
jgi:hypothetical protein